MQQQQYEKRHPAESENSPADQNEVGGGMGQDLNNAMDALKGLWGN